MPAEVTNSHNRHSTAAWSANLAFYTTVLIAAGMTLGFAMMVPTIASGQNLEFSLAWIPELDVTLSLRLDGLSLLFCLLISSIGVLVVLYSYSYFSKHPDHARLQWLLLAFMLSMLGLVTADNIIVLFVFWELTTITSFMLVGFDHENRKARISALQALLITGGGGLALLIGLILLGNVSESYTLSNIIANGTSVTTEAIYPLILLLVLIGAFTKSAQFPFHFWLPNAMAAPSPVSAYLHSATMVKAGIYLLMRLQPSLGGTDLWFYTLTTVGAITAVWASLMALKQTDMKLMLAWTTVMALGTLTLFLGSDLRITALAAVTFLLVHAFYKCALFLVIGNVDKLTGTREIDKLGRLIRSMPITSFIALAAALSMAGFPPFLGFIGKELKYEGALAIADEPWIIVLAAVSANAMMVGVALTLVLRVFFGGVSSATPAGRDASPLMWIGPALLAIAGLLTGIFPELLAKSIITPAINEILTTRTDVKLSLWHGINVPLVLSIITVTLGSVIFWQLDRLKSLIISWVDRLFIDGDRSYHWMLGAIQRSANLITKTLQTGSLSHYLTVVFTTIVLVLSVALTAKPVAFEFGALTAVDPLVGVIVAIMILAALVVGISNSRLLSICALGIVGSGVAVVFLFFGAIDVAITQLMVETLFVVLIATVLTKLPRFPGKQHPGKAGALRDASIAIAAGLVVAVLTVAVALSPLDLSVTEFFEVNSLEKAYGRNIVNVILVDFRALDTMGEVAVVATAAMAVIALLKVRPHSQEQRS